ncbi:hypothetical protein LCGC14_1273040 [marine sediment metagenome]|uniref:Uncharacterized protein n=1 Tax=marine sediment metagenome TaxID=412755 RepID=A0A0F9KZE0_9ZZZZ
MKKIIESLKYIIKIPFFIIFVILLCFSSSSKEYKNYINEEKNGNNN